MNGHHGQLDARRARYTPTTPGDWLDTDGPPDNVGVALDQIRSGHIDRLFDGGIFETIDIDVVEDGGAVKLQLQQDGGGDLICQFAGIGYTLDCTPVLEVTLTAGTDASPQLNFVYITESGGVLTLTKDTSDWPATPHCPVAIVFVQSAASVAIDGAMKVHGYTDHLGAEAVNGHLSHVNKKLRRHADWDSGVAPSDLDVDDPDVYIATTAGVIFQLHDHTMPALNMRTGDPVFLVNDPTTAYKRITTFDDITQDASGGGINNKWMNPVLFGVVSENESECKLFINLPTDTYNNEASAQKDANQTAVYAFPSEFIGTAFLIARYTVQAKDSGAWSQSQKVDLRGTLPSSAPGGGFGIGDVTAASNLTNEMVTHGEGGGKGIKTSTLAIANTVRADGTIPLTAPWDNAGQRIRNTGVAEVAASAPTTAVGRLWLDTAASGSPGTSVHTVNRFTSSDDLTTSHEVALCDATLGAITMTLPAAAASSGRGYYVNKIDASANAVTIDGNGAETINGSATAVLVSQYDSVEIVCDGTEWWIIG